MLVRRPRPALVPLGGAISDYADVLLDDAENGRAAGALTVALTDAARTTLIGFREVRPGGAVERIYDHWRGPRRTVANSLCWNCPPYPWTEWWPDCPRTRPGSGSAPPGTGCGCAPPELRALLATGADGAPETPDCSWPVSSRLRDTVRARRSLHGWHAGAEGTAAARGGGRVADSGGALR